ncbi:MAG: hypothetical protein Q7T87_05850 [Polaromonas sp.]|nr:hypothetical protein [Polaromonas sp.]
MVGTVGAFFRGFSDVAEAFATGALGLVLTAALAMVFAGALAVAFTTALTAALAATFGVDLRDMAGFLVFSTRAALALVLAAGFPVVLALLFAADGRAGTGFLDFCTGMTNSSGLFFQKLFLPGTTTATHRDTGQLQGSVVASGTGRKKCPDRMQ